MLDLSIVIVNHKNKEHLEKCLSSLVPDLENSGLQASVIVVDNASGDDSEKLLAEKYPTAKFIKMEDNVGFGRAQNAGLKAATAKYYLILNPDTVIPPGQKTLRRLHDFMESRPRVGLVGPKILYPDGSLQYSCYRFPSFWQPVFSRTKFGQNGFGRKINEHFLMKDFDHNETRPVDWVMGSAMFVRHRALEQVGLFDEIYWMYAEDSDLCRRMWEAGWPVYYVHDAAISHEHQRGSAKVPGIIRAIFKNRLTREHLKSWFKYTWKWRGNKKYYERIP